jgi:UDP-2,3-diacylglucosamine pyrophosphatase LpxH
MPNIRYVCLSDLHLGEEDSLLTNVKPGGEIDLTSPSPALSRLAECLSELLKRNDPSAPKPTLILNGDILELALSDMDRAVAVFAQFVSLVMPENAEPFGEIICLPGNHDHHLWEIDRETQYLNYMRRVPKIEDLEPPWHTTKLFMDMQGKDRLVDRVLTEVTNRLEYLREREAEVLAAYPNYGVLNGGQRCVIFHHGHFVEAIYHLMSTLTSLVFPDQQLPDTVYALEGENFAWIDFFWSVMGRSGTVGTDIERIYEATNDEHSLQALTDSLATSFAQKYGVPRRWPGWLKEKVFKALLRQLIVKEVTGKQERQRASNEEAGQPLSESATKGLGWYMEGPLFNQVQVEHGAMPASVTFVFGHTHKPFQRIMNLKGYGQGVSVLNTGGWIVESIATEPLHGGALVLIDEELNAVNVRLYNEGDYMVHAEELVPPGEQHTTFWDQLNQIVKTDRQPWRSFSETVEHEVIVREKNLKSRVTRGESRKEQ